MSELTQCLDLLLHFKVDLQIAWLIQLILHPEGQGCGLLMEHPGGI